MTKKHLQKTIINRKVCICQNKLKHKINFGNLPLINNYTIKKKLKKIPNYYFSMSKLPFDSIKIFRA